MIKYISKNIKEIPTENWKDIEKRHSTNIELNICYERDEDNQEYLEINIKALKIERIY